MGCKCGPQEMNRLMAYQLVAPKRYEQGTIHKAGDIVDLSHYTDAQIADLLRYGQYVEVPDPPKPAKAAKAS